MADSVGNLPPLCAGSSKRCQSPGGEPYNVGAPFHQHRQGEAMGRKILLITTDQMRFDALG